MKLGKAIAALAAASMVIAPIEAAWACTPVSIYQDPDAESRAIRECAEAHATKQQMLRDIRAGRFLMSRVAKVAAILSGGLYGCEIDRTTAFQLMDAAIGDPVFPNVSGSDMLALRRLLIGNESLASHDRAREIVAQSWLRTGEEFREDQLFWTREELEQYLLVPENWAMVRDHPYQGEYYLGAARDYLVFKHLADPVGPYFDRERVVARAEATSRPGEDVVAAGLLLDPSLGPVDYARAAALIEWYSPYVFQSDSAAHGHAAEQWRYIAELMRRSDDAAVRATGALILATGDRTPRPDAVLPEVPGLLVLDDWREIYPEMEARVIGFSHLLANNYPRRSIRLREVGPVETGVLFGPDGKFQQLWLTSSSGSEALDRATTGMLERYLRPRIASLSLQGHLGRAVLVRLPTVEWRLSADSSRPQGGAFEDGRILVTHQPVSDFSSCGFP